ncbi:MAG: ClpXP protease specificity-enhancing factor [Gammaproteobacteria bacterium]|nr:ClpXP protease specificity-enhancing factor [Gammaproteobacteria bacterium]
MSKLITPYYIRAIHQWAVDNGLTPHVLVDVRQEGVRVPAGYDSDGEIVLNVHPQAVADLDLGDDWLFFHARFSGKSCAIEIPVTAVRAIFARENGEGMSFTIAEPVESGKASTEIPGRPPGGDNGPGKPPSLRVIK